MLHVRVARQLDLALTLRQVLDPGPEQLHPLGEIQRHVAQVKPQRRQNLVITRAAEMQARAGLTDVVGQAGLQCRVYVLVLERDLPVAVGEAGFQ